MLAWIVDNLPSLLISCFLAWLAWVGKRARELEEFKKLVAAELQHLAQRQAADEARAIHHYLRLSKRVPREPWGWWRRRKRSWENRHSHRVQHFTLLLLLREPTGVFNVVAAWESAASRLEVVNAVAARYGYDALTPDDLPYVEPGGRHAVFALDEGSYLVVEPTVRRRRWERGTHTA